MSAITTFKRSAPDFDKNPRLLKSQKKEESYILPNDITKDILKKLFIYGDKKPKGLDIVCKNWNYLQKAILFELPFFRRNTIDKICKKNKLSEEESKLQDNKFFKFLPFHASKQILHNIYLELNSIKCDFDTNIWNPKSEIILIEKTLFLLNIRSKETFESAEKFVDFLLLNHEIEAAFAFASICDTLKGYLNKRDSQYPLCQIIQGVLENAIGFKAAFKLTDKLNCSETMPANINAFMLNGLKELDRKMGTNLDLIMIEKINKNKFIEFIFEKFSANNATNQNLSEKNSIILLEKLIIPTTNFPTFHFQEKADLIAKFYSCISKTFSFDKKNKTEKNLIKICKLIVNYYLTPLKTYTKKFSTITLRATQALIKGLNLIPHPNLKSKIFLELFEPNFKGDMIDHEIEKIYYIESQLTYAIPTISIENYTHSLLMRGVDFFINTLRSHSQWKNFQDVFLAFCVQKVQMKLNPLEAVSVMYNDPEELMNGKDFNSLDSIMSNKDKTCEGLVFSEEEAFYIYNFLLEFLMAHDKHNEANFIFESIKYEPLKTLLNNSFKS